MCSSSEGFDQSSDPAAAIGIEQVEVPVAMRNQGDVNGTTTRLVAPRRRKMVLIKARPIRPFRQ
jgi:hypothetical protein